MKLVIVFLMAGALSLSASAQLANVSGTWELEMLWPEATSTGICTFEQEGDILTGTCGGDDRFPVRGRVEGDRLSWQFDVTQDGFAARMEFSGALDPQGTTITGSCSIVGLNTGTFRMKKTRS